MTNGLSKHNHWNEDGDLVVEQKTLFRQVGWRGQSGAFYGRHIPTETIRHHEKGGYSPVYEQIAIWSESEGWRD
ncbi:MAG: hypothetical protein KGL39_29950 [Patescibacteria group bacterium]|nr:hypothetical protein [Patescibacteria group bacterium]